MPYWLERTRAIVAVIVFVFLLVAQRALSSLEKRYRATEQPPVDLLVDTKSLRVFKRLLLLTYAVAAVEYTINGGQVHAGLVALAGLGLIGGLFLRIAAIRALGKYWNFHVVRYSGQPIVMYGVYRWLRHPAYFGNIYIPSLIVLASGACLAALFSIVWLTAFAIYRIRKEVEFRLCAPVF